MDTQASLDWAELEAILLRAGELQDAPDRITPTDAARIGIELGLDPTALQQAIVEAAAGALPVAGSGRRAALFGPAAVVRNGVSDKSPGRLRDDAAYFLRARGLRPAADGGWHQGSAWWPDIYRFRARTDLHVTVVAEEATRRMWVRADLRPLRLFHGVLTALALLLLPLCLLVAGLGVLAGVMGAGAGAAAAVVGYRHRVAGIERRLEGFVATAADPAYRLAPW